MKGWIYIITHQRQSDKKNLFPGMCYVGQHIGQNISERFKQHIRDAKNFKRDENKVKEGKGAKLHEAMGIAGVKNFKIEPLQEFENCNRDALEEILNEAENQFINDHNSIEDGWNKVQAPRKKSKTASSEKSLKAIALENGINYNSFLHRINNLEESVEEAINHLKNYANQEEILYGYKRQSFKTISELCESVLHNKHGLKRKTIETRVRKLKDNGKLETTYNDAGQLTLFLPEEVFAAIRRRSEYSVKTPTGDTITGSMTYLHGKLSQEFPDHVPLAFTTLQQRLTRSNWTVQQAFGFDLPPDLQEVQPLIQEKGYRWFEEPKSIRQDSAPVVLHSKKEIFASQKDFASAYGIANDTVSRHLAEGKTADEILNQFNLTP